MVDIKSHLSKSSVKLAINSTVGIIVVCLLLVGIYALGFIARQQSAEYHAMREEMTELDRKVAATREDIVRLQREKKRMQTAQGVEDAARSHLGMVRPGEEVYVVNQPLPPAPVIEKNEKEYSTKDNSSKYFKILGNVIY